MDKEAKQEIKIITENLRNDLIKAFASENALILINDFMQIAIERAMVEYDLYNSRKDQRKSYRY